MKKIALIGSTGSIGVQTLNVVRRYPEQFKIISLSAGNNSTLLSNQVKEFCPKIVSSIKPLDEKVKGISYYSGENSFVNAITSQADIVVIALVGFSGIIAVLDAINKGKNIALANKECLVFGGELVTKLAKEKGVSIAPIDSEHSAIWQALNFDYNTPFNKIILTASGGAFRDLPIEKLNEVTIKQALNHPNWKMGNKITIDCATMVNKAYEVIEAKWLYNTTFDKINVIIHKESIIHSMVEYADSSVIAQLSYPNMELPIQLALTYPNRLNCRLDSLDFAKIGTLSFSEVDANRYPCFDLMLNAGKKGGLYASCAGGANDYAVKLFLDGKIKFTDIYNAIDYALQNFNPDSKYCFETIVSANDYATKKVKEFFGV